MRVRMKTRAAAPGQNVVYQPGKVYEVDDATAVAWLNGGYAEAVKAGEMETTEKAKAETAERPKAADREPAGLADEPTKAIEGIGPKRALMLARVGLETIGDLAGADVAQVAEAAGVGEEEAARWVDDARVLCEE